MKIDLEKLNKLVEDKYLSCQKHETEDLLIWNYTHFCQFDRYWTEETMMCRGLITDLEGNIVQRPLKKFFNVGEGHVPGEPAVPLPDEPFEVYEKLDGSLGILYFDSDNRPCIATRGSFKSEQAIKGTEILRSRCDGSEFRRDWTYLWEIIYPENRIVVDYGGLETLILLDVLDTATGESVLDLVDHPIPFQCAKRYSFKDLSELEVSRDNAEGYVVRFKSGLRVKYKFEEYCRLHKLITGINDKRIWEILASGDSVESMIESVPDEFYQYVKGVADDLHQKYADIMADVDRHVKMAKMEDDRARQAKIIKKCVCPGAGFAMLDGKDYGKVIWGQLKPKVENEYEGQGA